MAPKPVQKHFIISLLKSKAFVALYPEFFFISLFIPVKISRSGAVVVFTQFNIQQSAFVSSKLQIRLKSLVIGLSHLTRLDDMFIYHRKDKCVSL